MTIAATLMHYMAEHGFPYDVVDHARSHSSMESARLTHIPANSLAKAVVLEDEKGCLMAVLPATYQIDLSMLSDRLERDLELANEPKLKVLFTDCDPGAIPPIGQAYGIDTIVDESVVDIDDLYFEAGDHERLIHMRGTAFMKMMENARRGRFSHPNL